MTPAAGPGRRRELLCPTCGPFSFDMPEGTTEVHCPFCETLVHTEDPDTAKSADPATSVDPLPECLDTRLIDVAAVPTRWERARYWVHRNRKILITAALLVIAADHVHMRRRLDRLEGR